MTELLIWRTIAGFFFGAFLMTAYLLKKAYKDRDRCMDEAMLANGRYWNMARIIRDDQVHDIGIGDIDDGE